MKTLRKVLRLIPFTLLPLCGMAQANYVAEKTIPLTGNGGYDYAFIDQANHILYASHGTAVNVVDLKTEKQVLYAVVEGKISFKWVSMGC